VPAKSVQEIVALARAQPGKLTFGHAGVGTPAHLAGELFKVRARLDIQAVPYRGMPVALPDLLSGIITMMFPNLQVALPLVRTGQARALAVTSLQRFSATPDIPTMVEQGFPEFEANAWFGLMAPAGTPAPVIEKLHRETVRVLGLADARRKLGELGLDVVANSPVEFATLIHSETQSWAKVIKDAGIKPD
jgi:tripartite-type tricarboxylate transporter receptor subunit TctC